MMLKVAFLRLNLNNVKSAYSVLNIESEALHRLMKFCRAGAYKSLVCIGGNYSDVVLEILNRDTWLERNG